MKLERNCSRANYQGLEIILRIDFGNCHFGSNVSKKYGKDDLIISIFQKKNYTAHYEHDIKMVKYLIIFYDELISSKSYAIESTHKKWFCPIESC